MRILIVSDAWEPQVNGVVRTLRAVRDELVMQGHEVVLITPDQFGSLPCPTYPEIRLALATAQRIGNRLAAAAPDAIHVATEGPLGLAARRWCVRNGHAFTTAYHTQFPDYLAKRTGLPASLFWRYIRWFHRPAHAVLVSTPTVARHLNAHGLPQTRLWGRGVDLDCFHPDAGPSADFATLGRPIQLYVGRVAVEKNIEAFLQTRQPGTKVVVGGGPALEALRKQYPDTVFLGPRQGMALAAAYADADLFVFPSRTDTFGLVMIEALACGTPVAAYDVGGPRDIVTQDTGSLSDDLGAAVQAALTKPRASCIERAQDFTWSAAARQFVASLVPLGAPRAEWQQRTWMPRAA